MSPNTAVEEVQRKAAEVTPERLALWHDYPWTEAGESILVNAEWHGPRCRVNVTRKYADCNCTLVGAVISIEVEAVIVHRLMVMGADPVGPNDITVGVAESASWVEDQWPDEVAWLREHPDPLSMAHPALARAALVQFGVHGSGCGVWTTTSTPSEPVDPRCTCGLSEAIRDCTNRLAVR